MALNAKRMKVSGSTAGTKASIKKDGYAAGKVPDSMIPKKLGKGPNVPYSGPNVAKISRDEF